MSMHFCNSNFGCCRRRFCVLSSRIRRTMRSRIGESCKYAQKLHVCARVRSAATYFSMPSPSFCDRLLKIKRSYVSLVSPWAYLSIASKIAPSFFLVLFGNVKTVINLDGLLSYAVLEECHSVFFGLLLKLSYNGILSPPLFVGFPIFRLAF